MSCHGSSWSRRDLSSWLNRQDASRGSPASTRFKNIKRQRPGHSLPPGDFGQGTEEPSVQSKVQPRQLLGAHLAAAEQRSGLREGGGGEEGVLCNQREPWRPDSSHKSGRPHPRARARFSRRPFVSATAGQSPPRSAAGPSERQTSYAPRFLAADSTPRSSRPPRTLTLPRAFSTAGPIASCIGETGPSVAAQGGWRGEVRTGETVTNRTQRR